ncbi:MAG: asparagine synthase (glutamine-hydrolyzing) [Bacteroidetes bacterium]|nr:asparagine synthase (glutamine-hydrolyzing) [Bacteroidota bacterium]
MCGITGYFAEEDLDGRAMMHEIRHRGPDSNGYFEEAVSGRKLFFGHQRLSIVDLSSNGSQPMRTHDGRVTIIFNGEIYNFLALKDQYLKGYEFRSATDTEVLLYLYDKLGIDFVKLLRGDYSIAIYDARERKIFLIRDHAGIKPLYYYSDPSAFIFASEIKSILKAGVDPNLNQDQLQNYFVFKYVPQNETLFAGIKRLPSGHYLEYRLDEKKYSIHEFWKLKKNEEYARMSYPEARQFLYDKLGETVRMQLMADVPIGTFFSGGVDSSIIAYLIKDNRDIVHYSARKKQEDLKNEGTTSDFFYASKLAKEWNLNLHPVDIGSDETNIEMIRKTIHGNDDLIADGSQIPSYLITSEAGKRSRVMLSGMGADEIFLGYPGHQISMISMMMDHLPKIFAKGMNGIFASLSQGKGAFKAYRRYLYKLGSYYKYKNLRYGYFNIVGNVEDALDLYSDDSGSTQKLFGSYFQNDESVFDNIAKFEFDNFLVKNLHYIDRMSMINSVESRVPFLDKELIEFAYSLPLKYKLPSPAKTKFILKDSFRNQLPDYVTHRRKAGFGMPLRSIFSDPANVYRLLDKNFFSSFSYFKVENIERCVSNHTSGKVDNSALIYALISYQEWYRMYINK